MAIDYERYQDFPLPDGPPVPLQPQKPQYDWGAVERQLRQAGGSLYDPSDLEGIQRNTGYDVGGVSLEQALSNQFGIYDKRRGPANQHSPQQATSQYSGSAAPQMPPAVSPFTEEMRNILRQQLGVAQQAPTVNDPGIAENLAGRRLALQRSSERQQAANAEMLAAGGLADSGAAETSRLGIQQARGEAEARGAGEVLANEVAQRRQYLTNLLSLALHTGDSESARQIQMALAQMQQGQFEDQMAYNYGALNTNSNLQALMSLLEAL